MRYIKIRAKTYNEAMMKLKMDHGDDAIPISHKYVKEGGILNSKFFAKDVVELTAAIQERKGSSKLMSEKRKIDYTVGDSDIKYDTASNKMQDIIDKSLYKTTGEVNLESLNKTVDDLNKNLNGFNTVKTVQKKSMQPVENISEKGGPVMNNENSELRTESIRKFEKEFEEIKAALNKIIIDKNKDHERGYNPDDDLLIKPYFDMLRNNDFDNEDCASIINEVKNSISKDDLKDKYKIEKSLRDLLKSKIITTGPIKMGNKKKIIMFIGPTGVGKTTTMAKLGAINSLREGHNVAFITIDNYRIAATEQLKKYAEIMSIPIYAVNNQKEFKDIITKHSAEIIMVDTSGRSHRNDLKISEIKSFAELVEYDFEKILCVSANTKKNDLKEVFRAFDTIHFNSIVITKVDETSFIGNVIDIADKYNKPISYYTNGQEVPNDIVVADPDKIVEMMMGNNK